MPKLTIDNREIEVPAGTKVIEAAERLGIMIPRFCYHPALGAVGACRVCAVAFEEGPVQGIQMSCMVNAQDGMVVSTTDDEAVDFRRHVIEWLMLNHPHDCPVCDEGGHCLLQDLTVSGGHGLRRYQGLKRTHWDQYLGPLVQHEMNRCIQCYRCARYYQEFSGYKDLGVMGIGTRVYFGRSGPGALESPFAGNLIDICPTGVYTDKPSRYVGRRWDLERSPSICLHCSLGCNLTASARYRRVVRHEARPNPDVNGHFICDRGRYGYPYADSEKRPRKAMEKGAVREAAQVLIAARRQLAAVVEKFGARSVAAVGSARSSLETLAVVKRLCTENQWRGPAVLPEARRAENLKAAVEGMTSDLAVSLGAVSVADCVLVIGADPVNEAPMLALALRQSQRQGGYVAVIDPRAVEMPLDFDHLPEPPSQIRAVAEQLKRQAEDASADIQKPGEETNDRVADLAARLSGCKRAVIVCGTDITTAADVESVAQLAGAVRKTGTEAKLFHLLAGANACAAALLMEDPLSVEEILEQIEADRIKALVVVENDLWTGYPDRQRLNRALEKLACFILMDYVDSPLVSTADAFLPSLTIYESGGFWINQEGRCQRAQAVMAGGASIESTGGGNHPPRTFGQTIPGGEPEAAWRLASALSQNGDARDAGQADRYLKDALASARALLGDIQDGRRISFKEGKDYGPESSAPGTSIPEQGITLLLIEKTFGTEMLSAASSALAEAATKPVAAMHPQTATELGCQPESAVVITTEHGALSVTVGLDDRMAAGVITVPRHPALEWQVLGATRLVLTPDQIKAVQ